MQLSRRGKSSGQKPRGFFATGAYIVRRETPLGLYKGLGAVVAGIVPKMAIRFMSFEYYKAALADRETGVTSARGVFLGAYARDCFHCAAGAMSWICSHADLETLLYCPSSHRRCSWSRCWYYGVRFDWRLAIDDGSAARRLPVLRMLY